MPILLLLFIFILLLLGMPDAAAIFAATLFNGFEALATAAAAAAAEVTG